MRTTYEGDDSDYEDDTDGSQGDKIKVDVDESRCQASERERADESEVARMIHFCYLELTFRTGRPSPTGCWIEWILNDVQLLFLSLSCPLLQGHVWESYTCTVSLFLIDFSNATTDTHEQ